MALLTILQYPDPRLKNIAKSVEISEILNKKIQNIISDMFETMYAAKGIGLAAIQVNIDLQIITIDLLEPEFKPLCLINPKIILKEGSVVSEEGCLSFPGVYAKVSRFKNIKVDFFDARGEPQTLQAEQLLGACIQHEIDHLNGITFFDHLSQLKRSLLERKLKKLNREK